MVLGSDLRRANGRGAAALVVVLAAALTACSDDSGGGSTTPPTPSVEQSSSAPPSPTATVTAPADPAAAEKEVRQNWEKFFDPAVSLKDKQAVLENGARMSEVLQGFSGDERGRQVQSQVQKVQFTSPTDAEVTYALLLKGATALPGAAGTAVEQDGTWKVSVNTLCALVQLSGNESPGPGC
ncbi:hypothetical protein AB0D57_08280 [Streptomyces sp. NPDC048275]|uniref:hypothetical protein n=1 Tax=Streptomyces sp. NPDC048275 TaxID=3155629 RepID=UPI0033CB4084